MSRRFRSSQAIVLAVVAAAVIAPANGRADGLPVPMDDAGPTGLVSADGGARYVALPAGRDTMVERVAPRGGRVLGSRLVHGKFTIPVVAFDGTTSGLSRDGHTLVLIRPRVGFPRSSTTLAILDAKLLRPRRTLTLRGDFSFDAISADGRTAYLIQYASRSDATRYRVRQLDAASGRLAPGAIVDPHERGDDMRGYPLARAASADGRWDYTLYDGAGKHPFIHALDTVGHRAVCVDLPSFLVNQGSDMWSYHLKLGRGGTALLLSSLKAPPAAVIDTSTFRVRIPGVRAHGSPHATQTAVHGWTAAIATAALLLLAAAVWATRRRRGVTARAWKARRETTV